MNTSVRIVFIMLCLYSAGCPNNTEFEKTTVVDSNIKINEQETNTQLKTNDFSNSHKIAFENIVNLYKMQYEFQSQLFKDQNNNNIGEFANNIDILRFGTNIPFDCINSSILATDGYYYISYIPSIDSTINNLEAQCRLAEENFIIYAWPEVFGVTGTKTYIARPNYSFIFSTERRFSGTNKMPKLITSSSTAEYDSWSINYKIHDCSAEKKAIIYCYKEALKSKNYALQTGYSSLFNLDSYCAVHIDYFGMGDCAYITRFDSTNNSNNGYLYIYLGKLGIRDFSSLEKLNKFRDTSTISLKTWENTRCTFYTK